MHYTVVGKNVFGDFFIQFFVTKLKGTNQCFTKEFSDIVCALTLIPKKKVGWVHKKGPCNSLIFQFLSDPC